MKYQFKPMNENFVKEIKTWDYEGIYEIYSYSQDSSIEKKEYWDHVFAVLDEFDEVVAEVTFYHQDDDLYCTSDDMFYGQGLRPDLCGKGLGKDLIEQSIQFGIRHFNYNRPYLYLDVLTFNKRAYKAYLKAGFEEWMEYHLEYEGKSYNFYRMRYHIK